jgi:ABC-type nitrate/sulfonate/bicarbonate transport system substrate-binding protein
MRKRRRVRLAVVSALTAVVVTAGITGSLASAGTQKVGTSRSGHTLTVGVQEAFSMLPIFIALRHNYFKGTPISGVKFVIFNSLPAEFAAISQGQLDLGTQTITGANNFNKATTGSKLEVIAPNLVGGLNWAVLNGSSIPTATASNWKSTVAAFKGMKIGVPAVGGILDLYTRYLASQVGLTYGSDYTTVPVGAGPTAVAALQAHQVDVIAGDAANVAPLVDQKIGHAVLDQSLNQGPPDLLHSISGVFLAGQNSVQSDPTLYTAFSNAMAKARAYMANPKAKKDILDILTRKVGLSQGEANYLESSYVPGALASAKLNQALFNSTIATYVSTGVMTPPAPAWSDIVAPFAH